ncbi:recombinase family protein [Micromonospora sp. NPDC002575]|uniref:recombinase family protein n=1 Tax=Micromonospora sp. NPDC002575 TaxID=3364222 RepID=UPI0036D16407
MGAHPTGTASPTPDRTPNPGKAADGRRLHKLEPDPVTAPVVQRIFAMCLANNGYFAIAEALTRDGIPSPSAADPGRNPHRTGEGWAKSAVKNILSNPRYTGRQVWNKQRKDEALLDVNDVALGYETRMRWNDRDSWVWSDMIAHPPLVTVNDFELVQRIMAASGRGRTGTRQRKVRRHYLLRGLMLCGLCGRKRQSHQAHDAAYYRCRYPNEYALANHVQHPRNAYVAERDVVPALDNWLLKAFAPHRLTDTIRRLYAASPTPDPAPSRRISSRRTRSLPRATPNSFSTAPLPTPEATPPPSPPGWPRSTPNAPLPSPNATKQHENLLPAASPRTTSEASSAASTTSVTPCATPGARTRATSTASYGSHSPTTPVKTKSASRLSLTLITVG